MMVEGSAVGGARGGAWKAPLRCLLALFLLVALAVGALGRTQAVWTCEGRVCSPDLARCCCVSEEEIRDGTCSRATAERPKGFCMGRCGCEPSVTASSVATLALAKSVASPIPFEIEPVAVLAPPFDLSPTFALLERPSVKPLPPPRGVPSPCTVVPSLRAPPFPRV